MFYKLFKYIEPIWLGADDKISIRRVLTLIFSFNLVLNITRTINKLQPGQTFSDVAVLLSIEAGLIAALMSLTTYSSLVNKKPSSDAETD